MFTSRRDLIVQTLLLSAVTAGFVSISPPFSSAQVAEEVDGNVDATTGGPAAEGVYVRDSTEAVDQFALADRLVSLGEWDKAAEVYQEAAERLGRQLVAARSNESGSVYQYRPVLEAIRDRLADWPEEGREAYRARFALPAAQRLDAARTYDAASPERAAALDGLVRTYFLTPAAVEAAVELVDRRLVEGAFRDAARDVATMLERHPDLAELTIGEDGPNARAVMLLRGVVSEQLSGNSERAATYAAELNESFPQEMGRIAGQDVSLAQAAQNLLEEPSASAAPLPADIWPTFDGSADRNRIAQATPGRIAPLFTIAAPPVEVPSNQSRQVVESLYADGRNKHQMTGIFPAASGRALYWTDNVRVYAVNLESRLPLPGWMATYPTGGEDGAAGAFRLEGAGWTTPRGAVLAPVIDGDRLLVNMGLRDEGLIQNGGRVPTAPTQLVCLDRFTGELLWSTHPDEFDRLPDDVSLPGGDAEALLEDLTDCQFVGTPVVAGGLVWTLAKTDPRRAQQFEECFLVGLDGETGALRRVTYLATASQDQLRYQAAQLEPETDPMLAVSDGLIYAPTGRGVLAAVSAVDGRVRWLNVYERLPVGERVNGRFGRFGRFNNRRGGRMTTARDRSRTTPGQPYYASVPIVEDGRVFYRPPDADAVLIYDAAAGTRLARLPTRAPERAGDEDEVRSLLAVDGDRLFAFGSRTIYCLNWPAIVAAGDAFDELDSAEWAFWDSDGFVAEGVTGPETILGRPAVTETHVLAPAGDRLVMIDIETGRRDDEKLGDAQFWSSLPEATQYGAALVDDVPEGEAGNVLVLGDRVIVAGPQAIGVFADREAVRRKLEARRQETPDDPTPLLALAELDFVTGDVESAVTLLEEAAQRPDGADAAFESALTLAGSGSRLGLDEQDEQRSTEALLALAESLAHSPRQHVRARLQRAEFTGAVGGAGERVAVLQEILAEPEWRRVPTIVREDPNNPLSTRSAGEIARARIDALVAEEGPALYAEIEARAAGELEAAGDDAEVLQRVADVYPNSEAARSALEHLAELHLAAGELQEARGALRELQRRALLAEDIEAVNAHALRLAQLDLDMGGRLAVAAERLRTVASRSPDLVVPPLVIPGGDRLEDLTADEAAFELNRLALQARRRTPAAGIPTDPTAVPFRSEPTASIEGIDSLLPTPNEMSRSDRLVTHHADGGVAAFTFGQENPLWSTKELDFVPEASGWIGDALLVWGEGGAARIDARGEIAWQRAAASIGSDNASLATAEPVPLRDPNAVADKSDQPGEAVQLEEELARLDLTVFDADERRAVQQALVALRTAARRGELAITQLPQRNRTGIRYATTNGPQVRLQVWADRAILEDTRVGVTRVLRVRAAGEADAPPEPTAPVALGPAGTVRLATPLHDGLALVTHGDERDQLTLINAGDGLERWSVPLPFGRASGTSAAGDYLAVRLHDVGESGATLLVVYDLDTGSVVATRRFDAVGIGELLNFLVLPGNQLVAVNSTAVQLIDLDDPSQSANGARATIQPVGMPESVVFLAAMPLPAGLLGEAPAVRWLGEPTGGRLASVGNYLLVFADPHQVARRDAMVIDLAKGQALRIEDEATDESTELLLTGGENRPESPDPSRLPLEQRRRAEQRLALRRAAADNARLVASQVADPGVLPAEQMWLDGTHVYLTGRRGVTAHDLAAPGGSVGPHWWRPNGPLDRAHDPAVILDLQTTDQFVLVFDSPEPEEEKEEANDADQTIVRVIPFSRAAVPPEGYESGLEHPSIELRSGEFGLGAEPLAWQTMPGGLAVLDAAGRLVFLAGTDR